MLSSYSITSGPGDERIKNFHDIIGGFRPNSFCGSPSPGKGGLVRLLRNAVTDRQASFSSAGWEAGNSREWRSKPAQSWREVHYHCHRTRYRRVGFSPDKSLQSRSKRWIIAEGSANMSNTTYNLRTGRAVLSIYLYSLKATIGPFSRI